MHAERSPIKQERTDAGKHPDRNAGSPGMVALREVIESAAQNGRSFQWISGVLAACLASGHATDGVYLAIEILQGSDDG